MTMRLLMVVISLVFASTVNLAADKWKPETAAIYLRELPCITYPIIARSAVVQGIVRVEAKYRDGKAVSIKLISGHPMLSDAAVAHAQQIRWEPGVNVDYVLVYDFQITDGTS